MSYRHREPTTLERRGVMPGLLDTKEIRSLPVIVFTSQGTRVRISARSTANVVGVTILAGPPTAVTKMAVCTTQRSRKRCYATASQAERPGSIGEALAGSKWGRLRHWAHSC